MSKEDFNGISEQRKAAFKRLRDAEALLGLSHREDGLRMKGPHARGAMYLAGYAVECKLKAIAMEVYRCRTLAELPAKLGVGEREIYTHGLETLMKHLPSYARFRRSAAWRSFARHLAHWRPSWRYDPEDHSNADATSFLESVRQVYDWLGNNG